MTTTAYDETDKIITEMTNKLFSSLEGALQDEELEELLEAAVALQPHIILSSNFTEYDQYQRLLMSRVWGRLSDLCRGTAQDITHKLREERGL